MALKAQVNRELSGKHFLSFLKDIKNIWVSETLKWQKELLLKSSSFVP